jgi:hypothetical protein
VKLARVAVVWQYLVAFRAVAKSARKASRSYQRTTLYVRAAQGLQLRDKKTERLARRVRAILPWFSESDGPAVRTWAEYEILCGQVFAAIRTGGVVSENGLIKRLVNDYRQMRNAQFLWATAIGLTPSSRLALRTQAPKLVDTLDLESFRADDRADEDAASGDGNGPSSPRTPKSAHTDPESS